MNVPILLAHDHTKPIGCVEVIDGALHVRFTADVKITKDMAFQIFGDAGLQVLECTEEDGVMLIRHGRILEWSLSPQPAGPNAGGEARPAAHRPSHTTTATPQGVASTDQLGGWFRSEKD